ncbi:hypothetical protein [uncultured Roseobacter sp.]|uniref:hypothetical protein n=1 Tax=uncultured Roseobacter sp. TaxID=114847 RepID=UPI002619BA1D|nr:hypothetical protein [uncultured Roseobacter sp.]
MVVSDNGTELTSNAMLKWQEVHNIVRLERMGGRIVLLAAGSVQLSAQHAGARNALEYAIRMIGEEAGAEHGEQAKDAIEETLRDEKAFRRATHCRFSQHLMQRQVADNFCLKPKTWVVPKAVKTQLMYSHRSLVTVTLDGCLT